MDSEESNFGVIADGQSGRSLDQLAIRARADPQVKEELYVRLMPAMKRVMTHYCTLNPILEPGDCLYNLYLATERVIRKFDPRQTTFVRYWASCASRAMVKCVALSRRVPVGEPYDDLLVEEPTEQPELNPLLDAYFRDLPQRGIDPLGITCVILRVADYTNREVAQMMGVSVERVKYLSRLARKDLRTYLRQEAERREAIE